MNNKEYTTLGVYDYIILGMGIDILLFYLLFSLLRIANAESELDQRWLGRALVIAIGRIAAIARFHFIRCGVPFSMKENVWQSAVAFR